MQYSLTVTKMALSKIFYAVRTPRPLCGVYISLSRPALFHFPIYASTTEIVLNNNETFGEFNIKKMFNAIIFF